MSKVKKTGAEHYELLFIIPNKFTEEESVTIAEKIKKIISDNEGTITLEENWGKKKLAYPINGNVHGYYYLTEFDCQKLDLARIDKLIRMSRDVLRHMIIRKMVKSEEDIQKDKKIAEKIAAKNIEKKEEEENKEEEKAAPKKEDKKMDLEDLDEKLDKILETDNLL